MKGRTTLIIAHRLSTMRNVDKILCLEGGVVSEEGPHSHLRNSGGIYMKYIELQNKMFMENVGVDKAELDQRKTEVKEAFQRGDASAGERLLETLLQDFQAVPPPPKTGPGAFLE